MTALFFRRFWPFLLAGALLVAIAVGCVLWLRRHDERERIKYQLAGRDTVIQWRTDTAAARTAERRVDSVTVKQILTVVKRDTLWRRDTLHLAGDTTSRVAIPVGVLLEHDSAFAACGRLNRSCAREHAADSLVIGELRQSLALARTGYAVPPPVPVKHWHLGISAGYGGTLARDSTGSRRLVTGPTVAIGGTWTHW